MIIGIDGNEANEAKRVGIGQYAFQVLMHLYEIRNSPPKADQSLAEKFKIYLKSSPLPDLPKENDWWRYEIIGPQKLWTQFALPFHLFFDSQKPDVFFSPSHYAPRFAPCKRVISIMDLSFLFFPDLFRRKDLYQLRFWTAYSVKKAEKIFTISNYSKSAICSYYKVPQEKVIVTYPGYDQKNYKLQITNDKFKINEIKEKYKIKNDYILFVGTVQPRKNIGRLIEAFYHMKNRNTLQLVIAGKRGWLYREIFEKVKNLHLEKAVIFCDFPSNEELAFLYQGARCFVLPSLYEGFGLPVIEAMVCGCPVVVSNVSSLPEIVGNAGVYIDPYDVSSIEKGMQKASFDKVLRKKLTTKGLERVKQFSWENCAQKTRAALEDIGSSS